MSWRPVQASGIVRNKGLEFRVMLPAGDKKLKVIFLMKTM